MLPIPVIQVNKMFKQLTKLTSIVLSHSASLRMPALFTIMLTLLNFSVACLNNSVKKNVNAFKTHPINQINKPIVPNLTCGFAFR